MAAAKSPISASYSGADDGVFSASAARASAVATMRSPVALKSFQLDGPPLQRVQANHEAIDYIGRWDDTKTARWAGSGLRFRFDGPLLFFVPGPKTLATEYPMLGWQVDGKTYTSHARRGVSIRLWPPEGQEQTIKTFPETPLDEAGASSSSSAQEQAQIPGEASSSTAAEAEDLVRPTLTHHGHSTSSNLNLSLSTTLDEMTISSHEGEDPSSAATPTVSSFSQFDKTSDSLEYRRANPDYNKRTSRLIEITLIDWGSVLQLGHLETLAGNSIFPAYPEGLASLPTMLFIGDSLTSGYLGAPNLGGTDTDEHCGFLDAYPSQLRSLLAPGVRVSAVAFPGITLVDSGLEDGMESKFFKAGPLELDSDHDWDFADREDATAPTHIFVSLGINDTAAPDRFLSTFESLLNILKETYGRRTGDIIVLSPFEPTSAEQTNSNSKSNSSSSKPDSTAFGSGSVMDTRLWQQLKERIDRLSQEWDSDDPLATGDFPATPIFELTKAQLEAAAASASAGSGGISNHNPFSPSFHKSSGSGSRPASGSYRPNSGSSGFAAALQAQLAKGGGSPAKLTLSKDTLPRSSSNSSIVSMTRPFLVVRPSSIAAVAPNARGTKTRLHYVDTTGWLDSADTFDGEHPNRRGARKIARRLKAWLGDNGFLSER